jgi:type IV secretion system protein VirB11
MDLSPNNKPAKDEQVKQLIRPLTAFLSNPGITEITINKPQEIWVRTKQGWTSHVIQELTLDYLHSLATAIIVFNGLPMKSINSVILPGGQRGQIVLPPACIEGTLSMSIRKHSMVVRTLEELEAEGTLNSFRDVSFNKPTKQEAEKLLKSQDFTRLTDFEVELLELKRQGAIKQFLERAVQLKRNIIIAGKTGSGKTTFARSLIKKVPAYERLITIEDVHELFLENHPNRVHMLYGDGEGRITAGDALKSCMRQSPDRIFLAELRGSETWEYLNSLNTGHPGSITTTHANNCLQTFERVTTLIKKSKVGGQLNMETIKLTLYNTLDIVLFLKDFKLTEIFYDPIFAKSKMA